MDIKSIEEAYLGDTDWETKENANMSRSPGGLLDYLLDKLLKTETVLSQFLPSEAVKAHFRGDIHIHKLPYSLWIPYCAGWSLAKLMRMGLKTPSLVTSPPKHFSSAVSQSTDFLYISQQEWSGAQAFTAFDLYTAPFVKHDSLSDAEIRQKLQSMLYQLNVPARIGMQTPFTNITLMLDTVKDLLDSPAYVAGEEAGTLGDYLDEALKVVKALLELYLEGDALGQPFTFPIPTIMLTKDFDWTGRRWGELTDLIFEALAKRGTAYMLNGYVSDVKALYAMCCRLTIDVSQLSLELPLREGWTRGVWALPDGTGSVGVVTINLPRLAATSKGERDVFEEKLADMCGYARRVLKAWRARYQKMLRAGLLPITETYLGHFGNHYNTIGLIGLPEAAANLMRKPEVWSEGSTREMKAAIELEKKMVGYVRKVAREYAEQDGVLYNVEEIPGESTSYRLASMDAQLFKGRDDVLIPGDRNAVFYSNSIVPYYADVPIFKRALWEGEVQGEFTGGVMMHLFLAESPDPQALRKLVRRIAENTKVVYFSITPTISICRKCGWSAIGLIDECPKCGAETDIWSRIVGYYRPVRNWNVGKKAEFKSRVIYRV